ncbi:AEC family transporter [Rhodobacteraceae bacterium B1Z28]|uniref:AEC family transporter n=1 Tax=Ruegeria haliotis TaxID=2747601 RepID=A0ABX2PXS6_9RHOB|nr:AEC family transporter [Ruegeria haliotis]NVO58445.1 AEC family transporter [Ruegeria haliotis]
MLTTLTSILPIFLIIALGLALRKGGIPSTDFWNLNDKLVYWVLMPCLLFSKISLSPLDKSALGLYSVTILGGFVAALMFAVISARLFGFAAPQGTSILQGSARHNSFIGLALAANLFGPTGLDIAILATAILVPITNIVMVIMLVGALQNNKATNLPVAILRELARNPYVISILLAVGANQLIGDRIPVIHDVADVLGAGALPITLLAVGANLRVRAMAASALPLILAFTGKMVIFPVVVLIVGLMVGLPQNVLQVAVVYAVVPTGASSYTLSKQLGGDAPLMAAIVTLQTLIAAVSIPLSLAILLPLVG